jgi:hypothetical protein
MGGIAHQHESRLMRRLWNDERASNAGASITKIQTPRVRAPLVDYLYPRIA